MASFFKDFLSVGLSKISVIAFGLGRTIIFARILGPENNGIIASLIVFPNLLMTFGALGIRQSTTYYVGQGTYTDKQLKSSIAQIWLFTAIISSALSFILIKLAINVVANDLFIMLAVMPVPFTLFNTYNSGIFLGKNQIGKFNKINWVPYAISFLVTVVLVFVLETGVEGALIALAAGPAFMFILLLFHNDFIRYFNFRFDIPVIKSLLSLGFVYAFALLIINLNYKADILLLDNLSTPYELGIYSKGAEITEYLWQLPMLLSTIVFARSANAKDAKAFSLKVSQLLRIAGLFVGLGATFLAVFAKFIIPLLYGEEFFDSITVLQWLLPGVFLLTIFKVLNMDLAGKGKPWVSVKAMFPAIIVNLVLNFFLIPRYGADGAAIASMISYSLAAVLFLVLYSYETGLTIKEILIVKREDAHELLKPIKKILSK